MQLRSGKRTLRATTMATAAAPPPAQAEDKQWFALASEAVAAELGVDEQAGLSPAEAATRLETYGPNAFVAAETEPRWRAFVRQYRDPMQIVLLVAGIGSIWPLHELGTGLVLLFLTLFNAVLGLNQEGKAAAAVAALQKMMIVKAKVRRGGELVQVPAEQLVPGDVVSIEAGDVVPADGRLLKAATLEVAESALTGESMPVAKSPETVTQVDAPLGDRTDMVYMNTNVTRGTGELIVTTTGMSTEVGHISNMLSQESESASPLTKQLNKLTSQILVISGTALAVSIVLNVSRGESFDTVFLAAIAFAIAAIPTGPAGGGDRDPLDGHADPREGERHHEAAALDRDARLHVGHQLRQDRDADAQPDDRGGADDPGPPLLDRRQRLLDAGRDQEGRGAGGRRPRAVHAAAGARLRRCRPRRGADRRPDRGRPRRARREGRARSGRHARDLSAGRGTAVRHRVQADGDLPPDEGSSRAATSSAASSRARPTSCSPARPRPSLPTIST